MTAHRDNTNTFSAEDKIDLVLLENRTFYLSGDVEDSSITDCIKWIQYHHIKKKSGKLNIIINSYGGDLYSAFGLIDVMNASSITIATYGLGAIMSAGFLIFTSGAKNNRFIGRNAGIMMHQYAQSFDVMKHHEFVSAMKEGNHCMERMTSILCENTGMKPAAVKKIFLKDADAYFTAEQLIENNAADQIFQSTALIY